MLKTVPLACMEIINCMGDYQQLKQHQTVEKKLVQDKAEVTDELITVCLWARYSAV